ncbi:MAG: hypothetical protein ACRDBM_17770 [Sporomusa sp.]
MKSITTTLAALVLSLLTLTAMTGIKLVQVNEYDTFTITHYVVIDDVSMFKTYKSK